MKLIGQDAELMKDYFEEAAQLLGTDVFYYAVISDKENIYHDKDIKYKAKKQVSILLQEHPTVRTLKMYGWYKENEKSNPMIGFFPMSLDDFSINAKVEFESHIGFVLRSYEITEITQHYDYPSYWIAKLAPYTTDDSTEPKYKEVPDYDKGQYISNPIRR